MNDILNDAVSLEAPHVGPEGFDPFWDKIDGHHFDKKGNSISFRDWTRLWSMSESYRIIRQEYVGDYWISTVWLGLDHNWGGGAPHIFETMVFNHTLPKPPPPSKFLEKAEKLLAKMQGEEVEEEDDDDDWMPELTSMSDLDCERYATEEQAIAGHEAMVAKVRLIVDATS